MAVTMVMIAILVMVVVSVIVLMLAMTARRMTVRGMIMRCVLPGSGFQRMRMGGFGIGAALRIEWRFDFDHPSPQARNHRLNDVIAPIPQALGHDLCRQMAIAKVPGDANQMLRILAANLSKRLGRGDHLDQPTILEHQRVTAAKRDRFFQIEQKRQPARPRHGHSPPVPVIEIKHDGIGGRLAPAMLPMDLGGADHEMLTASRPCHR
jgi:hypothetical protein